MLSDCPCVCEFSLGIHAGKMSHECSQQLQVSPRSPEQDGFHDTVDKHMTSISLLTYVLTSPPRVELFLGVSSVGRYYPCGGWAFHSQHGRRLCE